MFSKKAHIDVKKSTLKIQDAKKDLTTRLKHLKILLENLDIAESKGLFEANFSHVYNVLYDSFIQAETNLRQRELSFHLVHKAHKEELECALWVLEWVLALLPELLHKRWQLHSLRRLISKLLHPGNSVRVRRQGIKYFLMWYQALGDNAPGIVHDMFGSLVPMGMATNLMSPLPLPTPPPHPVVSGTSVFHDSGGGGVPVSASELGPLLPASSATTDRMSAPELLDTLLQHMVNTVVRLEWHDKAARHHRCFHFLLQQFRSHYLPYICPTFCHDTSLYRPILDLPTVRQPEPDTEQQHCRVVLIKWLVSHMHQPHKQTPPDPPQHDDDSTHDSTPHHSLESSVSVNVPRSVNDEELAGRIVRDILCSSRDNVNFMHEMYRQAFLLSFTHSGAIHRVIALYKELIQMSELPQYLLEPGDGDVGVGMGMEAAVPIRPARLRNDSYIGAVHKENLLVRAGFQNMLQVFITHAAHVFLQDSSGVGGGAGGNLLEEQTDSCKRVLNIYRYMVMHTRMSASTWEQLLLVLLQITALVLPPYPPPPPPPPRAHTLGAKLAQAIFQTLIVTWIKANLNVPVQRPLWDRFLHVLQGLTRWDELINEWAKTMDTLTRVLARHVYGLDLTDLPLDRLSEQKNKRTRRVTSRTESCPAQALPAVSKPDETSAVDGQATSLCQRPGGTLSRSVSETSLHVKRRYRRSLRLRRAHSLGTLSSVVDVATASPSGGTRSPSPAPSSGIESTSIKDSPIQLDVLAADGGGGGGGSGSVGQGVVCGGTVKGWLPDVAVVLWRRMLQALGDVNQLPVPRLHAELFDYLLRLTDTLIRIQQNQGVSDDNQSTPSPPELVPPMTLVVPWCLGALLLPADYQAGKVSALRLLCSITLHSGRGGGYITAASTTSSRHYLPHLYRTLHVGLTGGDREHRSVLLQYLGGARFLSLRLPGHSLLLADLVHACHAVITTGGTGGEALDAPPTRIQAVSTLAGLLAVCQATTTLAGAVVLQPLQPEQLQLQLQLAPCPDIKDHVVQLLMHAARYEPIPKARCIAISALGIFVYRSLWLCEWQRSGGGVHVKEALSCVLSALRCEGPVLAAAADTLSLLAEHAPQLHQHSAAASVITALGEALCTHTQANSTLLLCLGHWCMCLGPAALLHTPASSTTTTTTTNTTSTSTCLLLDVFQVLHHLLSTPTPLCASTILSHLITHLAHFPMAIGAARLSSLVVEHDDVPNLTADQLSTTIFSAPNIQLLMQGGRVVTSLVEVPALELPGGGVTAGLTTADRQVRVLLRDQSGKACWDASILYRTPVSLVPSPVTSSRSSSRQLLPPSLAADSLLSVAARQAPHHAMRRRPRHQLPDVANAAPDLDQLDDLLQYLGYTSPECLDTCECVLNGPASPPLPCSEELEQEAIGAVLSQRGAVLSWCSSSGGGSVGQHVTPPLPPRAQQTSAPFQYCRLLFSQLGLASWEHRNQLYLLDKTERLLRELRNLDTQQCRETHKVAVVYVGPGQEDKNTILSNRSGSQAFEQFVAGLGWEVELEGHTGFMGGLHRQGSTGHTAPYYATSFLELIYHVATRMPGDTPEAVLNKTRHLGNDEVHIVWSEHNRDYRRDIIPTEFCDVLIVVYPLDSQLNRVSISCKAEVPHFGPLYDEAIVESVVLPGLVRATAIAASRAKRATLPYYQQYYEERQRSLDTVLQKHISRTTFEDFISAVFSPATSSTQPPPSLSAALLDHKAVDGTRAVWFNSSDSTQNISPRPLKKLSSNVKPTHERGPGSPVHTHTQPTRRK